jgi:TolB protein
MSVRFVGQLAAAVLSLMICAAPAQAAFPGSNGKIAFSSDPERSGEASLWVMNPDGTGQTEIRGVDEEGLGSRLPAWEPGGREIAFTEVHGQFGPPGSYIYLAEADGTNARQLGVGTGSATHAEWAPDGQIFAVEEGGFPTHIFIRDRDGDLVSEIPSSPSGESDFLGEWSPDGESIVFARADLPPCGIPGCPPSSARIYAFDLDTQQVSPLTTLAAPDTFDADPSVSPDGQTVVFSSNRAGSGRRDLYTVPIGGGVPMQLTDTPTLSETEPAWSPDGTKIAFTGRVSPTAGADVYVINANGTGSTPLTTSPGSETSPAWQRLLPLPGFVRPKSARRIRVPLVPAYQECTAPNRTHGPPLVAGSCNPPAQASTSATFGTPDANGFPANSNGFVMLTTQPGNPATTADEADVSIEVRLTDVRRAGSAASDYSTYVLAYIPFRLTDKLNGCCSFPATVQDPISLFIETPCATVPDPAVGGTCSITTTADTFIPGMVREGQRAVWQLLAPVRVDDDEGNLLATQGVFVP